MSTPVLELGPKEKKSVAYAIDWPGWSRGAKTPEAAIDVLASYRQRYRPIAGIAGLEAERERWSKRIDTPERDPPTSGAFRSRPRRMNASR